MSVIRDDDEPGTVLRVIVITIAVVVLVTSAYLIGTWSLQP